VATKSTRRTGTKVRTGGARPSTVVSLNMRGVEGRTGGRVHYPEGDYLVKVTKAELGKSSEKETPAAIMSFQFTQDKALKGKNIREYFYLTDKAMWKVRNLLEACGVKVPDKSFNFDFAKLVGKSLAITIEDEEYDNKTRSRITDTFTEAEFSSNVMDEDEEELDVDEDEEDEEEEDEDEEEEDDEEDEEDDDLDEVDLDDV